MSSPLDASTDEQSWRWWSHEPLRWAGDRDDLAALFPDLTWTPDDAGRWSGELPMWPFDRPRPAGLPALLDGKRLLVEVRCGQAYPIIAPRVFPLRPEPTILQRTRHDWHVNGDGSLCLLADPSVWTGRQALSELLLKAAGWRVEYALMIAGALDRMTDNGIVSDPVHDELITRTGSDLSTATP